MNPHRAGKSVDEFDETPSKYPSQLPPISNGKSLHVLIVGGGVGGLFLAILLDRAGISYEVFERASGIKALGSIMDINACILPVLEQLDIYEEFKTISLPSGTMGLRYGDMKKIAEINTDNTREVIGYDFMMLPRPKLHEFLYSKVRSDKVHFSKKVLSILQNKEGAMIRCADGTTYHGDLIVGADGAYSGVRQSLYKQLQEKNLSPPSDGKEMNKGFTCLVGTTNPLDPEKYSIVTKEFSESYSIIGQGTPYTWVFFNVPGNRICYAVVRQFATMAECENEKFRNSEWGPEKSGNMVNEVRDFKTPFGTMGDLIDQTPKDTISRVYLEDKLFSTWNYGRTALIGDAAHKMLPSAGQGAVCAMQDAVILTNCLYDLEEINQKSIEAALCDYKEQRYPQVKIQVENSNVNATLLIGQTIMEKVLRFVVFNWLPQSMKNKAIIKDASYRPQIAFLPLAPKRGTGPVQPQRPSKRYEEEQRKKRERGEKKKEEEEVETKKEE